MCLCSIANLICLVAYTELWDCRNPSYAMRIPTYEQNHLRGYTNPKSYHIAFNHASGPQTLLSKPRSNRYTKGHLSQLSASPVDGAQVSQHGGSGLESWLKQ